MVAAVAEGFAITQSRRALGAWQDRQRRRGAEARPDAQAQRATLSRLASLFPKNVQVT
jgi:hypothetical protein